jgi:rare lipoprotein A
MPQFSRVFIYFFLLFSVFLTGCVKNISNVPAVKKAYCVSEFSTYVKFCNVRRPVSNHVQDGSLIAIRTLNGKVIKVAAYYDSRWELCLPKTYKRFFKTGRYVTVEVLRCGYSKNKPYCPYTVKEGYASWYGYGDGSGKWTASGRPFNPESYGLANKELPFGTLVKITNLLNGRSVYAVVLDRGPYVKGRDFDLYPKTMRALGGIKMGVIPVRVEVIRCGWDVKY